MQVIIFVQHMEIVGYGAWLRTPLAVHVSGLGHAVNEFTESGAALVPLIVILVGRSRIC